MPRKKPAAPALHQDQSARKAAVLPPCASADNRHLFAGTRHHSLLFWTLTPANRTATAAHEAWATANAEYERRLAGDITTDTASSTPAPAITPLSPRDAAGIAAEPLRQLLNAGELGRISSEQEQIAGISRADSGTRHEASAGYRGYPRSRAGKGSNHAEIRG